MLVQQMLCEHCIYYDYDEEYEEYSCMVDFMDQDDYSKIIQSEYKECPYYRMGDEYKIVHKQI